VRDPAAAVTETSDLHDEVDGGGHLLADGPHRQVEARHEHEGLETSERVAR
jgi:hypothetical protein